MYWLKCGPCLCHVFQLKNLTGMNQRRWYETLILTVWLVSQAQDQFFFLLSFLINCMRLKCFGSWLLFSKRKLQFVTGHRVCLCSPAWPVTCQFCFTVWEFALLLRSFFPLYKRTHKSVILLLNHNKVYICVFNILLVFYLLIKMNNRTKSKWTK